MNNQQFISTLKAYADRHGRDDLLRMMEVKHPSSSSVFINRLYHELNGIVREMEQFADRHKGDDEENLTINIVRQLRRTGYSASHDTYSKGHPDIYIVQDEFTWLGECKLHSTYDWLVEGLKQLYEKYSTGKEDGLGLLIYIQRKDAQAILDEWRSRLMADGTCALKTTKDGAKADKLCFWSVHKHAVTGIDVETKHIGVALFVHPKG
jgi:hypothetical protein